jgi:hypothetical protein
MTRHTWYRISPGQKEREMPRSKQIWSLLIILMLMALPAAALSDDPFWDEDETAEEVVPGTGTGGGPYMLWLSHDFDGVNAILENDLQGLAGIPDLDLYWGGAGWFSISAGKKMHVALGGGGFGGSSEVSEGDRRSKWSLSGGYFSVRGIYPAHRNIYLNAGVDLGGGSSELWVERTDAATGLIEVHLRGERNFLLVRPTAGVEIRLARWIGILLEGGYNITSGDWSLEGRQNLIEGLDFGSGDDFFASVMVRFGI